MDEDAVHEDAAVALEELSPTMTVLDTPTEPSEENVPAGAVAQSQQGGSAKRLRWQSTAAITTVNSSGEPTVVYPFLNHDNWLDIMLVRQLIFEQPFAAAFGQSGQKWKDCARALSKTKDPDGFLVYGTAGVSEKSIKNRFDDLMAFMRERQNLVPFRSGCDNEPASEGELASALDYLYEIVTDSIAEREATTALTAKRKAVEAANAEVLRDASLGMLTEKKRKSIQHKNKRSNSLTSPGDGSGSKGTPATVASGSNKKVQ